MFQSFFNEIKINLEFQFKSSEVIKPMSIFLILLILLWNLMAFFTKLHVLIHLNKMGWLGARIDILLKLLVLF